jgi:energy-coupling factor transporter ATP-binding protein EcfA2
MASRTSFNFSQKHLLLVAGVSGSGKSTFIREFLRGTLPPDLRSALPSDADRWTHAFGRESRWFLRGGRFSERPRGQILHQEITESYRSKQCIESTQKPAQIYRAEESPQLLKRIAAAEAIYLVIVRPTQQTLIRQLGERTAVLHFPPIARAGAARFVPQIQWVERVLPAWITVNAAKMFGRRWAHRARIRGANDNLCDLYAQPDAVEAIYRHWEASLFALCGEKIATPVVYVEPAGEGDRTKAFRLADLMFRPRDAQTSIAHRRAHVVASG